MVVRCGGDVVGVYGGVVGVVVWYGVVGRVGVLMRWRWCGGWCDVVVMGWCDGVVDVC